MGKTWKDKPLNVEDVPVYKRRNRGLSGCKRAIKPQPEDAEAEMLARDLDYLKSEGVWYTNYKDPWSA